MLVFWILIDILDFIRLENSTVVDVHKSKIPYDPGEVQILELFLPGAQYMPP